MTDYQTWAHSEMQYFPVGNGPGVGEPPRGVGVGAILDEAWVFLGCSFLSVAPARGNGFLLCFLFVMFCAQRY
jgi:hypothetical protein